MWLHKCDPVFLFSQPLKTRKAALPYPGQTRTPACSLWTRKLWSTTLPLTQGKQIPVSLHPPSPASMKHAPRFRASQLRLWSVNQMFDVVFGPSLSSQQRSDRAHKPGNLPGGRRCGCRDGRSPLHPQDKAQGRRLSSPRHPDPADGATADHEGWVEGQPLFCSHYFSRPHLQINHQCAAL